MVCEPAGTMISPPRRTWTISQTRLPIVPLATKSAASLAVSSAARSSSSMTVGSSPKTSSPSSASAIARRISEVGRVPARCRRPTASCARSGETFGSRTGGPFLNPDLIGWIVFATVVPTMLALDLLVFNRRPHVLSLREAGAWVAVWVSLGLGFGALVFATRGAVSGTEYMTGYLLEYSLSMDNVFVFAMLFAYFGVPPE